MNKILMSTIAIAAVVVVAGVGSYALWSDTETAEDNYIAAGSLDLLVNGENSDGSAVFTIENVVPGDTDSAGGAVTNDGSIDGNLTFSISSVADIENELIEPEAEDGDTTSGVGELCGQVDVQITYDGSVVYAWGPIDDVGTVNLGPLNAGGTVGYGIAYTVKSNADNKIMTDKCEFDMELILNQ